MLINDRGISFHTRKKEVRVLPAGFKLYKQLQGPLGSLPLRMCNSSTSHPSASSIMAGCLSHEPSLTV